MLWKSTRTCDNEKIKNVKKKLDSIRCGLCLQSVCLILMFALLKIMGKSGVISLGNMPLAYWIGGSMFLKPWTCLDSYL
jgi:hypothetical protein